MYCFRVLFFQLHIIFEMAATTNKYIAQLLRVFILFYADGEKPNGDEDVYKYEFRSAHNRVILNYIVKIQLLTASANIQVTNPLLAVTKTAIMAGDFVKMLLNMRIYSLGKGIKL